MPSPSWSSNTKSISSFMAQTMINVSRVVMKLATLMLSHQELRIAVHPFEFQGNVPRMDMDISRIGALPRAWVCHLRNCLILDPYQVTGRVVETLFGSV